MSRKHIKKYIQKYHLFFSVAIALGILFACNATKKIPDEDFLLTKNNFKYTDGKAFSNEIPDYVYQKPNKNFLYLFPLRLGLYNMANPKYDTLLSEYMTFPSEMRNQKLRDSLFIKYGMENEVGKNLLFNRFMHTVGEAPVILDQNKTATSAENIESRLVYRGYWDADVKFQHHLDSTRKKAKVDYIITKNEPTKINGYYYNIPDENIKAIYEDEYEKSHILNGDILDQTKLEQEVSRITQQMKDRGYYRFNSSNDEIFFTADTLSSRKNVPLILEIKKDTANTPYKKTTIGNIKVHLLEKLIDTIDTDKETFLGIDFHKLDNQYRTISLWRPIILKTGELYQQKNLDLSKRNIASTNNFRILDYREKLRTDADTILDISYYLAPLPKYEFRITTDLNYSQILNVGISPSIDLTSRNVFGQAENLTTSLSGTFGSVVNTKNTDKRSLAYEISAQSSLSFPRFLLPFKSYKLIPKRYSPTSNINLGVSVQNNIGLGRINFNTGLNYLANVNDLVTHRFAVLNTQLSLTKNKDRYYEFFPADGEVRNRMFQQYSSTLYNDFINQNISSDEASSIILNDIQYQNSLSGTELDLYNTFLQTIINKDRQTQDVIISSFSYNFIYNEIGKKDRLNPFYFNGKIETAGNLLGLFTKVEKQQGMASGNNTQKTIFDIPYSQFIKFDFDVRKYFQFFDGKHTLVFRQFIGVGIPYGNSSNMPFVRSYFNGGSNDIRAWSIFGGLGPAASQLDEKVRAYAMDNIKLTTNVEYRFPFNTMFEGATFVDAGNIWSLSKNGNFDDEFKFNRFISEMGVGAGFGLRINVAYITLRLDAAWKIHEPNKPVGSRWIHQWHTPRLNFAFGYPF